MIREELRKYLDSDPPEPPISTDDFDGDGDDEDRTKICFYHAVGDEMIESDFVRTTVKDWKSRSDSNDPRWSVVKSDGLICALGVQTYQGTARRAFNSRHGRVISSDKAPDFDDETQSSATWRLQDEDSSRIAKVTWYVTTPAKWKRDTKRTSGAWHAQQISPRKILVMLVQS
jgi:hypothetical protein